MIIVTILIFLVILSILVFVHEFGHFYIAKKSGMRVEEFGFGFPPRLIGVRKVLGKWELVNVKNPVPIDDNEDHTIYSINAIPLGGFVRIVGENNEKEQDPRSFINKPFINRLAVLVAGVIMNVLLAWFLISIGYMVGLPVAVDSPDQIPAHAQFTAPVTEVISVQPGLAADAAGIKPGDKIIAVDGQMFGSLTDTQSYIRSHPGNRFDFEIKRGSNDEHIFVNSNPAPGPNEGPTGIALASVGRLKFAWYSSIWEGAKTVYTQVITIFSGLYQLFTTKAGVKNIGGPVKIAQLTGQVANLGFVYLMQFTAFLSLNLAVLNILPFPALDGGRVLFLLIEKIRGKRNNQTVEQVVNTAGFLVLLMLMVVVTFKDLNGFTALGHLFHK